MCCVTESSVRVGSGGVRFRLVLGISSKIIVRIRGSSCRLGDCFGICRLFMGFRSYEISILISLLVVSTHTLPN